MSISHYRKNIDGGRLDGGGVAVDGVGPGGININLFVYTCILGYGRSSNWSNIIPSSKKSSSDIIE